MNTSIQDAIALGHSLAAAVNGRANGTQLDDYEKLRRPIAKRVVAFTDRMTWMATMRTRTRRAMRNAMLGVIGRTPARRWLAFELSGLRNR